MPARLRKKIDPKSRKFLLAEFDRICRQERTPNEQMVEGYLQCEETQKASKSIASVVGVKYNDRPIQTPTALLPWLQ
jgi:hypothetical protein